MTVQTIYDVLNSIAPFANSMDFDNTGILVGDPQQEVTTALLCLDVTQAVLREAVEKNVQLIISHHPVIFHPLRQVQTENPVYKAIRAGISVISAHTNLDKAFPFGTNHALCMALGLTEVHGCIPDGTGFIAYSGTLPKPMTDLEFAKHLKAALHRDAVQYTPSDKKIRTVAVVSGAGGEYAPEACALGADAFVTGEVKHHEAIAARESGFALYEAGHYHTEEIYKPLLQRALSARCPEVCFLCAQQETAPMLFA